MKMAHPDFASILEWNSRFPASLVVEHPQTFLQLVSDLTMQEAGTEGTLVFSDKGQILSIPKSVLLIRDLWSVDVNKKKLLNGVYAELKRIAQEEYYSEVQKLLLGMSALIGDLSRESMLSLLWEEQPDITTVFKIMNVQNESVNDPFERLLDYVRLSQEYLHTKLVILVGVRSFLSTEEFDALSRDFSARGLCVLFVDGISFPIIKGEKRLLIDGDRCELLFG